jgi:hypothetical protein
MSERFQGFRVILFYVFLCAMAGVALAERGKSRIVRIEVVERISPAFNGRSFGNAGQYEWVRARAHAVVDPASGS